tara:strand:- start:176 stop:421 length:246 start_codon:yes stop_codon:yes gene_type:complete
MNTLSEQLNFKTGSTPNNDRAILIDRRRDINFYETLALYAANNDIDLRQFKDSDVDSAALIMSDYGSLVNSYPCKYWFWVD